LYASISVHIIKKEYESEKQGTWIRLDRQIAVMGLADLERKSAQREKQGEEVWFGMGM
jgi:hypothetical protein